MQIRHTILKKKKLKTTLDSFLKDVQWIKTAAANVKKTNSTKLTDVTSSGSMNETEENMVEREDDEHDDDGSRGESNGAGFGLQYNMRGQAANVKKTNSTKLTDVTSSGSMNETEENMVEREDDEHDDDGSRGESNGAGFGLQYNMRGQAANVKKTNSTKLTDVTSSGSMNETEENMVEREDDEHDDDGSRGESNGAGFGLQYNMRGQAANVKKTNSTKLTDVTSSGSMNETEENMVEREDDEHDDDGSRGESNGAGFGLQYNMRGQAANVKKTNSTKLTDVTSSGSMNETEENMVEREDDEHDDDGSRGESNGAGFGLQYNMRGQAANVKKTNSTKLTDVTSSGSMNETEENMVEREDDEHDDDGSRGESNGAGFGLQYNMRGQGDADVNTTADVNTADAEVIHADCDVSFYSNDDLSLSEGQEYRPGSSSEDGSDSSDSYESPKFPMLTKCGKLNDSNMTVNEASPQKKTRKSDADESSSSVDDVDCRDVSEDLDLDNDAVSSKDNIRKVYSLSEDEIVRDKNLKNVYIRKLLNSNISKFGKPKKHETVWNQAHYCTFCCKIVTNFTKHLKLKHKKEKLVKEVVNMGNILGKRHKQVMGKWNSIKSKMDHENNIRVLKEEKGEMVLARRKGGIFDVSRYGPCPNCCIWLSLDKTLLQHQSSCPESTTHYGTGREMRIASLVRAGRLNVNASDALKNEVFTIMTPDEVGKVALSDSLIIMLGNIWMAKNFGNKLKRKYYTSSRMRDAARLLINLRELSGQNLNMLQFIEPEFFDMFVKAALKTSSPQMDDFEDLESPSTAIKLGYDLKRLTNSKLGIAIKEDNAEERKKSLDFLKLMEMEWSLKVTRLASITLQQRRFNKDRQLPNPDDIVQISKTVKLESKKMEEKMNKPDAACFRRGVMLAQTRLLLFNKRRAGEIEGISIKQYLSRKSGITDLDKAMRSDLTDVELKLLETQEVLETRGKYGRGVPVIIPRDSSSLLRYLANASVRREAGIKDENHYLFPNTNVGVIRSYDSLKSLCSEMNLKSPEHITSVNLRKYTATLSQVLDLSSQEQSWLVNHLGHSLDVHKIHYRQTASTIERIDISKMMILQEFNLTSKYAGKQLKDIDLKELMIDSDGHVTQKDQIDDDDNGGPIVTPFIDLDADSGEGYIPEMQNRVLDKDEYEFDEEDLEPAKKKKKRGNSNTNRVMWTKEEIEEIKVLFREELEAGITPGMRKIEKAKAKSRKNHGSLHLRHWEKIKKKIWNTIQKNK